MARQEDSDMKIVPDGAVEMPEPAEDSVEAMARLLDREKSFSVLSLEELGQLTSVDHYPSEEFVFSSYGCDLHIDNELVANAFAALPKQEQSILILFCVLELGDGEIGDLMGMSRSAVQRHRTKTLNDLQKKLKAHLPEGG